LFSATLSPLHSATNDKNSIRNSIVALNPMKKGMVKLYAKKLVLLEFGQLQSHHSILNLMMLYGSLLLASLLW